MNLAGLVHHLIDVGSYDQPPTLDTEDETPPPPAEEDTKEEESVGENERMDREDELEQEPIEEGNLGRNP